jgi:polysaccharide transporter, PST family
MQGWVRGIDILIFLRDRLLSKGISIRRIRESRLSQNIAALYGTQIASYIFPLLTVPYLARILGPFHWGMVAFAQALGLYLSIVVDFGFQLSATRQVAQMRDDREYLANVVAGVIGAKALLAIACLAALPLAQYFMISFRGYELIIWAGCLAGIGQGCSMLWFYQGIERMKIPAALDVLGRACAAGGVFLFVHKQADAWKVLALQFACYGGVSLSLLIMVYKEVPFRIPTRETTGRALRDSAGMFLFRSASSLYTIANTIILGAVSTPVAVGLYSGVERPVRALLSLMTPISQSLYPRLNKLLISDRQRAIALVRISFGVMVLGGVLLCVMVLLAAPAIVRVVLGPRFEPAVPVMRILSLLLPIIAASNVLGIQWMLPLGMDREFNKIIICAGLINLTLGLWWASRWQYVGMAWAVVAIEAMVTIAMWIILVKHKANPFTDSSYLRLRECR